MRIYFSAYSGPIITDTVNGLNLLAAKINDFLDSHDERIFVQADTSGSPAPYEVFLPSVEFEKGHGPIFVSRTAQVGLRIVGSSKNLRLWCNHLLFPPSAIDGDHHHPDQVHLPEYVAFSSMPVIIEVREEG